jgi:hypothetical protein
MKPNAFALLRTMFCPRFTLAHCARTAALITTSLVAFAEMAQAGPVSPLYLTTGSQIYVIQATSNVDSWPAGEQEYSIAVDATVRTYSQGAPMLSLLGHEYGLDGTPTGASYLNTVGCCFRDGTTDGMFNYAVRQGAGVAGVYRFDPDWTDPQVLPLNPFLVQGASGIAYDSSDDTFWLAHPASTAVITVVHITRGGDPLSVFPAGTGNGNVSLAYDRADDTLWVYVATPNASELRQYSASDATGQKLPLSTLPGIGFVAGMEFALQQEPSAVPEPASALLLCTGLVVLLALRRRRPAAASAEGAGY